MIAHKFVCVTSVLFSLLTLSSRLGEKKTTPVSVTSNNIFTILIIDQAPTISTLWGKDSVTVKHILNFRNENIDIDFMGSNRMLEVKQVLCWVGAWRTSHI